MRTLGWIYEYLGKFIIIQEVIEMNEGFLASTGAATQLLYSEDFLICAHQLFYSLVFKFSGKKEQSVNQCLSNWACSCDVLTQLTGNCHPYCNVSISDSTLCMGFRPPPPNSQLLTAGLK
jgi:hypothetical protein